MFPTLKKIRSDAEADAVIAAARANNDSMIAPTHVVMKDGEIAGAWSVNAIPLVLCWHHTERMKARDSLLMKNTVDAVLDSAGVRQYVTCCRSESPYMEHMEKFGYEPVWPTNLFLRDVRA